MTTKSKSSRRKSQQKEKENVQSDSIIEETMEVESSEAGEHERLEIFIRFPKMKCYKSALTTLVDTPRPIKVSSEMNFTAHFASRSVAEAAVERLSGTKIGSEPIKATLKADGDVVPTKRVVLVSRKAHFKEAVTVLKKVYSANEVWCTKKGTFTHLYTMEFDSAEAAEAAEQKEHVMYHGNELQVGAFIGPKKRKIETPTKEKDAKKAKLDEDAEESESKDGDKDETVEGEAEDEEEESAEEEEEENDDD